MPFVSIQGRRLFYKNIGAGRPLLLLPGLGADSTAYNSILPYLRGRVRVIAIDPPGVGRSDDPPEPLTVRLMARDLLELLNHLSVSRASLLGTSMGALVARYFAAIYPERMDRLILCSPGGGGSSYARRIRRLLRSLLEECDPQRFAMHFLTLILSPEFIDDHSDVVREMEKAFSPERRTTRIMLRQLTMMEDAAQDEIEKLHAPALLVIGGQDPLVPPRYVERLRRFLSGSELFIVPKAGHHLFLEAPEETMRKILSFLEVQ